MDHPEDVSTLVHEYRALFADKPTSDSALLKSELQRVAGWTPETSKRLVALARDYGSFALRNALAISIALGLEDGNLGL